MKIELDISPAAAAYVVACINLGTGYVLNKPVSEQTERVKNLLLIQKICLRAPDDSLEALTTKLGEVMESVM